MPFEIFQVDAFTRRPFAGNPAAVCLLTEPRDDVWLQNVASEMNLSETAFVEDDGVTFGLGQAIWENRDACVSSVGARWQSTGALRR